MIPTVHILVLVSQQLYSYAHTGQVCLHIFTHIHHYGQLYTISLIYTVVDYSYLPIKLITKDIIFKD